MNELKNILQQVKQAMDEERAAAIEAGYGEETQEKLAQRMGVCRFRNLIRKSDNSYKTIYEVMAELLVYANKADILAVIDWLMDKYNIDEDGDE